ncbi:MAG: anthranilate synthase component I [Actinomycetia bacterium]|nr:anthranilate synthase component I [Actinomycetes bacterium]
MYYPNLEEFKKLSKDFNLIPVYREVITDYDTPVSAFLKFGGGKYSFLLESIEGGERLGRYSFIGGHPKTVILAKNKKVKVIKKDRVNKIELDDPLKFVYEEVQKKKPAVIPNLPPFQGGALGYLGYDAIRYYENIPAEAEDNLNLPDMIFMLTDSLLIFDHLKHKIFILINAEVNEDSEIDEIYQSTIEKIEILSNRLKKPVKLTGFPDYQSNNKLDFHSNFKKEEFLSVVRKAKEYIFDGDILQTVLSQRFEMQTDAKPFDIYRALRTLNPSPYMYYLKFDDFILIGSSPEPLVQVEKDKVKTRPIAGTRKRGKTREEDAKMEKELLSDEKEKAEHLMLVDLGRNDLGRVCKPGSVNVDDMMFVEKYSHVMHMVTQVSGELQEDKNPFDALKSVFPAGTVSGAPKIRAMEIIDELEPCLRGPYGGAIGYLSYSLNLDTCLTIRTVVVMGNKAYVQAGAGIVADSIPELEFKETKNKAEALLLAVKLAEEIK